MYIKCQVYDAAWAEKICLGLSQFWFLVGKWLHDANFGSAIIIVFVIENYFQIISSQFCLNPISKASLT